MRDTSLQDLKNSQELQHRHSINLNHKMWQSITGNLSIPFKFLAETSMCSSKRGDGEVFLTRRWCARLNLPENTNTRLPGTQTWDAEKLQTVVDQRSLGLWQTVKTVTVKSLKAKSLVNY